MTMMTVMTAEQLELWRKLAERFQTLSPALAGGYDRTVNRMIQPVVDTWNVDCVSNQIRKNLSLTGTAGDFVNAGTVPNDETWRIEGVYREATTGASRVWSVKHPTQATNETAFAVSQTGEYAAFPNIWMPPGAEIGTEATANGADSSIEFGVALTAFKVAFYIPKFNP